MSLLARLGLDHPIVQAPMAGGTTTADLVIAVAEAGALGSFGAAYQTPDDIRRDVGVTRQRTSRAFAVNLFLDQGRAATPDEIARANAALLPEREALGLGPPPALELQIAALMDLAPPVFSSTFGAPEASLVRDAKARGMVVIGTATSPEEVAILDDRDVDAIVLQGAEAGGHRGTFAHDMSKGLFGVLALLSLARRETKRPLIAAGGLMTPEDVVAVLAGGAEAAQCGTAFLLAEEAGTHPTARAALASPRARTTVLTRAFSGRLARGLDTPMMRRFAALDAEIAPYPVQNALTGDLRKAAAAANDPDRMAIWAGTGAALARPLPARAIVEALTPGRG
jgi:nitronate monooxygenase